MVWKWGEQCKRIEWKKCHWDFFYKLTLLLLPAFYRGNNLRKWLEFGDRKNERRVMSLMKSGGISARTKSLRDKFKQKRSFSELSFQAPSTSTSSLATSDVPSRPGSLRRPRSHAPTLFDQVSWSKTQKILLHRPPLLHPFISPQSRTAIPAVLTQSLEVSGGFPAETLIQPITLKMPIVQLLILIAKVMSHVFHGRGMLPLNVILSVILHQLDRQALYQLPILQQPIYSHPGSKSRRNFPRPSTSDSGKVLRH